MILRLSIFSLHVTYQYFDPSVHEHMVQRFITVLRLTNYKLNRLMLSNTSFIHIFDLTRISIFHPRMAVEINESKFYHPVIGNVNVAEHIGPERKPDGKSKYRYTLRRTWGTFQDGTFNHLLIIGCNPSNATDIKTDPTMDQVTEIAYNNEYEGVIMANLFAYRDGSPKNMKDNARKEGWDFDDLRGPNWKEELLACVNMVQDVVFAYGSIGVTRWKGIGEGNSEAVAQVAALITFMRGKDKNVWAFGLVMQGHPCHPCPQGNPERREEIRTSERQNWIDLVQWWNSVLIFYKCTYWAHFPYLTLLSTHLCTYFSSFVNFYQF